MASFSHNISRILQDCLLCTLEQPLGFYCCLFCQLSVCFLSRGSLNEGEVKVCQLAVTGVDALVKADHCQRNIHNRIRNNTSNAAVDTHLFTKSSVCKYWYFTSLTSTVGL